MTSEPTTEETEQKVEYQCECIPKLRSALAQQHGTEITFSLAHYLRWPKEDEREDGNAITIMGFQPFFYSYKDKKKTVKRHVQFAFCPFCGKKFK